MAKKKRTCPLFLCGYLGQGSFFMNVLFCPLFQHLPYSLVIFHRYKNLAIQRKPKTLSKHNTFPGLWYISVINMIFGDLNSLEKYINDLIPVR